MAAGALISADDELDAPDTQTIAALKLSALHAFAVHVRPVRAPEVHDFQLFLPGSDPAVDSRNKRRVHDEVGARGTPDGFDGPWPKAELQRRLRFGGL